MKMQNALSSVGDFTGMEECDVKMLNVLSSVGDFTGMEECDVKIILYSSAEMTNACISSRDGLNGK